MDAIVIGSGPNGLTAAAHLALAGWSVLVLEASPHLGGACRTEELTIPGYKHDVGAAFFPFGPISPAFAPLDLGRHGLRWLHGPLDSAHPGPDGRCPTIGRDLAASARTFGRDADTWTALARWFRGCREELVPALLDPLVTPGSALALGVDDALTFAYAALNSGRSFGESRFCEESSRRVIPGLGLHADVAPDDPLGAAIGLVLGLLASDTGFGVAEGGAGAITGALRACIEAHGGQVRCGDRVEEILVRGGRAVAVRTASGLEIEASRAIIGDVGAAALYLRLLRGEHVPGRVQRAMRRFVQGWGTFKVDFALRGPVPWRHEEARRSAVVHAGDSVADLARFAAEVRAGELPSNPYLVVGQQSLIDPTRAPAGRHTLYVYSHTPSFVSGGWGEHRERFADAIERRLEGLAPGFRALVEARAISSPADLEAMNENLVGGDLGGGSAGILHQFFFRPVFPYFRYRTPVKGLYLGSSYAHPGTGVHGACGRNAAQMALADAG
jgi:phytoene dehydrogenase-like protein